jgi:predicted metal-binding protein
MLEQFIAALNNRAHEYGTLDTKEMVFSQEVIKACETNICGCYGKYWTCPPAVGSMQESQTKIQQWQKSFVFTTKGNLDDSFDFEGMQKAQLEHRKLTEEMKEKFGKTNPVYGVEGCTICKKCSYPDNPCRFPNRMCPSIEGTGLNISELGRSAGVKYINGINTVTFFSMILFN